MILQLFGLVDRDVFSEELPVSQHHAAETVHLNYVLVKLSDLNHLASLVPFSRVGTGLVLDSDSVANPSGGSCLVCSDQYSIAFMCRLRKAFSLATSVSRHVM